MFDHPIDTLLVLVPAMPLAATLVTALLGKRVLKEKSHWPVVAAIVTSFVLSAALLFQVRGEMEEASAGPGWERTVTLWQWATVANDLPREGSYAAADVHQNSALAEPLPDNLPFSVGVTLRADPLTCIMLCMVTFISSLVAIYASGYMHGDPGYWRFFTYIALFVFSMTMLVSVSNFVLLYVFWEAVGMCSYLLIGFWFEKPSAAAAGKKAFLVNRVGDFGFALGLFLIFITYGTLNFHDADGIAGVLGRTRLENPSLFADGAAATVICLLLLVGACGKSAQFPLHVWLPDAMEGPTPVSALIHAATMVTAGVYMITRCTPLFYAAPDAQRVVAVIGAITAVMAGFIAITQTDLKRVLAYSTVSQLGYMFLGLGVGSLAGITAGMFHLFTHAFFKALLFLGAGSVMHAMGGVIDMRQFSGLRRLMPITHATFLVGCLALAGLFPFSGFWSKDSIIAAVHERGFAEAGHEAAASPPGEVHAQNTAGGEGDLLYQVLFYVSLATALMTAAYTFRAFFLTFYGPERVPPEAGHHAHESPPSMTMPLVVLALFAAGVGGYFQYTGGFAEFLHGTPSLSFAAITAGAHAETFHFDVAGLLTAPVGIALAAWLYLSSTRPAERLARGMRPVYWLSWNKLFIDEIYGALFVWPAWLLARFSYWIDRYLIDGLVNLCGKIPPALGGLLRSLQTGMVQFYALAMVLGLLVLIGALWF